VLLSFPALEAFLFRFSRSLSLNVSFSPYASKQPARGVLIAALNASSSLNAHSSQGGDLAGRIKAQRGRLFPEELVLDWFCQVRPALEASTKPL